MPTYTALLRTLSAAELEQTLRACGRKEREGFFARHHVKAKPTLRTGLGQPDKTAQRAARLYEVLRASDDEPLAEELLRQWFLQHRPLLARALDELGIRHDEGLTNEPELKRFAALSEAEAEALSTTLAHSGVAGSAHAAIYVAYMRKQMVAAESG